MGKIIVEWGNEYDYAKAVTPHAAGVSRTWVWNDIGTATVAFPMTTPQLSKIIEWGQTIRIHEDGVPSWSGVVEGREWSAEGVALQLKSAEYLLTRKITGQGLFFQPGTRAGAIAYGLFVSAYLKNNYIHALKAGIFDASKPHFRLPYDYADLWTELKALADEDGAALWVDENLHVHFRNTRGSDKSATIKLREGKHLTNVRVHETIADAITAAVALGNGAEIQNKPQVAIKWDTDAKYFRAEVLNFSDINEREGLREPTRQTIRERGVPRVTLDADFIRTPSGEHWGAFFIGDVVEVEVSSYLGWPYFRARVLGIEMAGEDVMRLVLEIIPRSNNDFVFSAWTPTNAALL